MSDMTENIKKRFKAELLQESENAANDITITPKHINGFASFICFAWAIICTSNLLPDIKGWLDLSHNLTDWLSIITISVIAGFYFLTKNLKNK